MIVANKKTDIERGSIYSRSLDTVHKQCDFWIHKGKYVSECALFIMYGVVGSVSSKAQKTFLRLLKDLCAPDHLCCILICNLFEQ